MTTDLVIRNGLVVTPTGMIEGGLAAHQGTIVQVSENSSLPEGTLEVDAEGKLVLPGLIDPHVHPGFAAERGHGEDKFRDDVKAQSVVAAVAGVTTLIMYAIFGHFRESYLPCLRRARQIAEGSSLVDFRFHTMMMFPAHVQEIPRLFQEDVTSYKFTGGYTGEAAARMGLVPLGWEWMYRALEYVHNCGPPAMVMKHAEQADICEVLSQKLQAEGRSDLMAWSDARPGICEAIDIFTAGLMAETDGVPLYIVHNTSRQSIEAIRYFKKRGVPIYGETAPHYLSLTKYTDMGILAKASPPLREKEDQEELWRAVRDGTLDTVGSDDVVLKRSQKEAGGIWEGIAGFNGIGAILPVLLSEGVNKGRISIERLVKVASENTARLFGIYPKKGALSPGSDADIVIADPDIEWVMSKENLKLTSDFSVYEGKVVKGKAIKTFVRGKLVASEGELAAMPPHGKFVPRILREKRNSRGV